MKTFGLDPDLIRFLERPQSYTHHPEKVTHLQTHISHVFMAYPFVFKIKKPVNFGFLDYSTLEKRRAFCEHEVELNRRLCEDIYLGVEVIVKKDGCYEFVPEEKAGDTVVEYAVKMHELSKEHFLHVYIEKGTLTNQHLDRVADKLADFYLSQQADREIAKWGDIKNIRVNTDENFEQTESFIDKTIDENAFEAIRYFTNRYYEENEALFQRRIKEGRIVDGHGDLHLEHIHITDEQVRIYDCIEFNDRFRYGDLAADLAFLAMDLDFKECQKEERYFIRRMSEKLQDKDLPQIVNFYKCYRAYVKGKVKSLQSNEEEVPEVERKKAVAIASRYFDLSLRYALLGSKPSVVIFMGRVGTGKSTLAEYLGKKLDVPQFSSDRIRKGLAGIPPTKRVSEADRQSLYSSKMSQKTYSVLLEKAEQAVERGESAILDATFSHRPGRRKFVELLERHNVDYSFVEVLASENIIRKRLKSREQKESVISDARLEDFERLDAAYDVPDEIPPKHFVTINTETAFEQSVSQLYTKLADRQL